MMKEFLLVLLGIILGMLFSVYFFIGYAKKTSPYPHNVLYVTKIEKYDENNCLIYLNPTDEHRFTTLTTTIVLPCDQYHIGEVLTLVQNK